MTKKMIAMQPIVPDQETIKMVANFFTAPEDQFAMATLMDAIKMIHPVASVQAVQMCQKILSCFPTAISPAISPLYFMRFKELLEAIGGMQDFIKSARDRVANEDEPNSPFSPSSNDPPQ